ncbi:MAG: multicopper oxidase domain-containing protein [Deltaproteobacteria bacterium]|nr:multicopper oxidase domain-containing protein [Deltaproteobacteria bacterium]
MQTGGGLFPETPLYGYDFGGGTTYPGATILARKDRRIVVRWNNMLDNDAVAFPDSHLLSYLVDPTLHMAFPDHGVPVVTHLHGGHTESASDGLPEQWYTQGFAEMGDFFVKRDYLYGNDQNAATLWYHDHALGITRLNVYAGLAGFYLLTDANEQNLQDNNVLPSGDFDAEIVIQDRQFEIVDNVARLTLPAEFEAEDDPLPDIFNILCEDDGSPGWKEADEFPEETPSAVAEFFGDIIVVNGRAWPMYEVGQTKYRLRLLNGSDSRFYVLEFRDTATGAGFTYDFLVIGSDQGFLPAAITQSELLIAPGERYDVVFDFSSQGLGADDSVYLRNFGPDEPFKGIPQTPADEGSTGQIMRFDVKSTTTIPVPTTPPPVAGGTSFECRRPRSDA